MSLHFVTLSVVIIHLSICILVLEIELREGILSLLWSQFKVIKSLLAIQFLMKLKAQKPIFKQITENYGQHTIDLTRSIERRRTKLQKMKCDLTFLATFIYQVIYQISYNFTKMISDNLTSTFMQKSFPSPELKHMFTSIRAFQTTEFKTKFCISHLPDVSFPPIMKINEKR